MFGQGKIVEEFGYHNLKLNSVVFSLCLWHHRRENMRPCVPAGTVAPAERAWRGGSTAGLSGEEGVHMA